MDLSEKGYSLDLPTNELKEALQNLQRRLEKIKPKPNNPILDVVYVPRSITLILFNMKQYIKGYHQTYKRFTIPFELMFKVATNETKSKFNFNVRDGVIKTDGSEYSTKDIKILMPFDKTPIELPKIFTSIDVLAFRQKYSLQELKLRGCLEFLERYELQKKVDIDLTVQNLKRYELTKEELAKIIDKKVHERIFK